MFDKCVKCVRLGESCVPNIMLLPFHDLIQWCDKRQKYLGWSNHTLAEKSGVPNGTISRIKAGDYLDCRYSTIKAILVALIGGTTDEFSCTEQVERELRQIAELEKQAERASDLEKEVAALKHHIVAMEEQHRADIRAVIAEHKEQVDFLKDQLKAWQSWSTKKD